MSGTHVCKYHGGVTSLRYKGAIKNNKLRDAYVRHATDPLLTDQKDDLALLRAMCEAVLSSLDADDTSPLDPQFEGVDRPEKEAKLLNLIDRIDRIVKTVNDREAKNKLFVHIKDISNLLDRFTEIATRHIKDPAVLAAMVAELTGSATESRNPDEPAGDVS